MSESPAGRGGRARPLPVSGSRRAAARPEPPPPPPSRPARPGPTPAPPSRPDRQEVVLDVDSDLDTAGADRLRALLEDAVAPRRRVVLDLSRVAHLSSAALAVLVSGHRRLRDGGGEMVVRAPSAAVVRELRISGLHRVIAVDPPERG